MSFQESLRVLALDSPAGLAFLVAATVVLIATPVIARLAPRIGGVDDSSDRPRVHTRPVPRIGGLAIVAAIAVPAAVWIDLDGPYLGILLGTLCAAAIGLVDDIRGIRPSVKMAAILLVALIPIAGYDVRFDRVTLPLVGDHDLGWTAYPLTLVWIAAVANLVNLIDGMDGLAAGIVSIAAFSFALLGASFGRENAAVLGAAVCGATLAFLAH